MIETESRARRPPPLAVTVRPETPADYYAIAEMTTLAHHTEMEVGLLNGSLRHHRSYDPALSLVAEWEGSVVGHALFLPLEMLIAGERVPAVTLWVLTVAPGYQRRGVGGRLMDEGHRRARERGCHLSFLLGHDTYYPRAGYRTRMFGACRARVPRGAIRPAGGANDSRRLAVTERVLRPDDTAELVEMWWRWFGDVDLAVVPAATVSDWLSPYKPMRDHVLIRDGRLAGYARYLESEPHELRCFLARDAESTLDLLAFLGDKVGDEGQAELLVPVHPRCRAAREWLPAGTREEIEPWNAAMIKVLEPSNAALAAYVEEVAAGTRPIGCVIWPVEGDVV